MCHAQATGRLNVVASNSIVADWVRNIAGDHVELTVLVGPDADVHTFEPSPADDVVLNKADIIFEIGLGFEHWMDKLYKASASHAKRVILTNHVVVEPLTILKLGRLHGEDTDPHVWHNVRYVMGMVKRINTALKLADPVHGPMYDQKTQSYLQQLEKLDGWIMRETSQIPSAERKLVTNHDSLGYFCERYHFQLVGAAFNSATTEAEDPSAKDMAELIFKIKTSRVGVVFAENINNPKFIAMLASEAKVQLAPLLYTDALGGQDSPAGTYMDMMRYNVKTIVTAFEKDKPKT